MADATLAGWTQSGVAPGRRRAARRGRSPRRLASGAGTARARVVVAEATSVTAATMLAAVARRLEAAPGAVAGRRWPCSWVRSCCGSSPARSTVVELRSAKAAAGMAALATFASGMWRYRAAWQTAAVAAWIEARVDGLDNLLVTAVASAEMPGLSPAIRDEIARQADQPRRGAGARAARAAWPGRAASVGDGGTGGGRGVASGSRAHRRSRRSPSAPHGCGAGWALRSRRHGDAAAVPAPRAADHRQSRPGARAGRWIGAAGRAHRAPQRGVRRSGRRHHGTWRPAASRVRSNARGRRPRR